MTRLPSLFLRVAFGLLQEKNSQPLTKDAPELPAGRPATWRAVPDHVARRWPHVPRMVRPLKKETASPDLANSGLPDTSWPCTTRRYVMFAKTDLFQISDVWPDKRLPTITSSP